MGYSLHRSDLVGFGISVSSLSYSIIILQLSSLSTPIFNLILFFRWRFQQCSISLVEVRQGESLRKRREKSKSPDEILLPCLLYHYTICIVNVKPYLDIIQKFFLIVVSRCSVRVYVGRGCPADPKSLQGKGLRQQSGSKSYHSCASSGCPS